MPKAFCAGWGAGSVSSSRTVGALLPGWSPSPRPGFSDPTQDPFLTIGRRAVPSPKGKTRHANIDRILYGGD